MREQVKEGENVWRESGRGREREREEEWLERASDGDGLKKVQLERKVRVRGSDGERTSV